MQERRTPTRSRSKEEVIGSETIMETIKRKTPWILGSAIRKPKIMFPKVAPRRLAGRITGMQTKTLVVFAIYSILFILQTGVVYLVYRGTPALGQTGDETAMFLYPSTQEAFIIESIVASIMMIISSAGYLLLYRASQHLYDRKTARGILAMGILLVFVSYVVLQWMIATKSGVSIFDV